MKKIEFILKELLELLIALFILFGIFKLFESKIIEGLLMLILAQLWRIENQLKAQKEEHE